MHLGMHSSEDFTPFQLVVCLFTESHQSEINQEFANDSLQLLPNAYALKFKLRIRWSVFS